VRAGLGFGAVGLADGLLGTFARAIGVDFGAANPATENYLSRFGAHGYGITAAVAALGNPTRI